MKERVILHCDMNSFYASVELLSRPELKHEPVAVCGDPESRHGIILAKNEAAKKFGVTTAETLWQARKKCPDLILLKSHHGKYHEYSEKINAIYKRYTDMVEPFSIDESWLDVTGSLKLFGTGEKIAYEIKDTVKDELDLTLSVGVSFNKIFAKMGSDYKKPDAVTVISRENYKDLLWPMPVRELFSVGNATANKLNSMGIKTIGDLAGTDVLMLENMFGKSGRVIYEYANGMDESPVSGAEERRKIKTVGNGITFRRDLVGEEDILTGITALSDTVAGRLRKYGLKCWGIRVEIKTPGFETVSRQMQLDSPTNLADNIKNTSFRIINNFWNMNSPIRLITITAINLVSEDGEEQLTFFGNSDDTKKGEKLERAMDEIRDKFGSKSIKFGRILNNDLGISLDEHEDQNDE